MRGAHFGQPRKPRSAVGICARDAVERAETGETEKIATDARQEFGEVSTSAGDEPGRRR